MSYAVRQYPGESNPNGDVVTLTESHGSLGEAQVDMFGRGARWWDEDKSARKVTCPDAPDARATTAICWEEGKVVMVLTVERNEAAS